MQKCIIWLKNISRSRHGWIRTCVDFWYLLKKIKYCKENKVIFKTIIIFKLIFFWVYKWQFFVVVIAYVLNQFCGHLIFSDALHYAITMCLKLME